MGLPGLSLTYVGNPAPPMPTMPAWFTISMISSAVSSSMPLWGFTESSIAFFLSFLMTTESTSLPCVGWSLGSTAVTVPLTLEWMGLEMNPALSPIFCPTFT